MGQLDSNAPNDPPEDSAEAKSELRRSKVAPKIRALAIDWERRSREEQAELPIAHVTPDSAFVPRVPVLIELKSPDTSELEATGIEFEPLFERFVAADVGLDQVNDLADLDSVVHIHYDKPNKPALDDSIPEIRANTVRNPQFPFSGTNKFTGAGVVIGIIDSGINILHPVFRLPNDQTKTRILAILDQTQTPPATFNKARIEAAIASGTQIIPPGTTSLNDHKHGTHVASIAGGNGKKAGNCSGEFKYVGVAPEADLVIVKYNFGGARHLLAAIQFIANTAGAITPNPLPAVINMSLGNPLGPHDGTDPQDVMIDNYLLVRSVLPFPVAPVVLVAAAGNEGGHEVPGQERLWNGEDSHATGAIAAGGGVRTLRFRVNATKASSGQASTDIEIRFTAANGLACQLTSPGNNTDGRPNSVAADADTTFTEATQNSTCSIDSTVLDAATGSRLIAISITSSPTGKNQPGDWTIQLTNAGAAQITYHAWISGDQFDRFLDDLSRANTIRSPASATSIICVGSYHSSGKDKGRIWDSSSRGPRLDNLPKPDLVAPGVDICAAKRDLHIGCCCDCCCDSYLDMSGTSQAAPHVAGVIALMLQRNPALTHQQIKSLLIAQAEKDSFTGATANNDYGNGKLQTLKLLNAPLVRGSGTVIAAELTASPAIVTSKTIPGIGEIGPLPQLEPGTPLWRLLNTAEGQRLYHRGRKHWEELREIVNTQKRVATVWHRNYGPMLMHHATRTAMLPHVPLPREVDGIELRVRAAKLVTALEPFSSKELIRALHETLPLFTVLQGKTLLEVVEFFESCDELQHA